MNWTTLQVGEVSMYAKFKKSISLFRYGICSRKKYVHSHTSMDGWSINLNHKMYEYISVCYVIYGCYQLVTLCCLHKTSHKHADANR